MNRTILFALLTVSLAGCFPAIEKDPEFPKYFTKKVPGNTVQARLEGDRLYGASIEVKKDGNTFRGNGAGGVVDLRSSNSDNGIRIEGELAEGRTELYVTETEGGGLTAKGLIGGVVSHFDLTPTSFTGTVGACTYELGLSDESRPYYEGNRRCAGPGGGTRLALPANFETLPVDERAVFLAVFLAR